MVRSKAVVSVLLVFMACGGKEARQARTDSNTPASIPTGPASGEAADETLDPTIPAGARTDVAHAIALGTRLFMQDQASARATDVVLAGGAPAGVHGWITRQTDAGWQVDFIGTSAGRGVSLATVPLDDERVPGTPVRHATPVPLDETGQAMFAARAAAFAAFTPICGPELDGHYNVDVVPASLIGESGWYVYFTPGSKDLDAVVLSGHVRIAVDAAGARVTEIKPLSKSCVIQKKNAAPKPGDKLVAMSVTHFVTPTPTEAHVFASLLYRIPIYVMHTDGVLWLVDGGQITLEHVTAG